MSPVLAKQRVMLRAEERSGKNQLGSGEGGRHVLSKLPAREARRVDVGVHRRVTPGLHITGRRKVSRPACDCPRTAAPALKPPRRRGTPGQKEGDRLKFWMKNIVKKQFMGNNTNSKPNFNSHFYHSRTRKSYNWKKILRLMTKELVSFLFSGFLAICFYVVSICG